MIGLLGATALVVSGMVGAGILILPAIMDVFGTWSIFGWFIGASMALSIAIIFVRLNKRFNGLSAAECVAKEFSSTIGFLILFGYFVAMSFSGSCIAITFGNYSLPLLNMEVSAWIIGYVAIIILFLLNIVSVGSSNTLLTILTILKIAFFSLITIVGFQNIGLYSCNFGPTSSLFKSAAVSIFAFLGIEFAAVSSGNIRNSEITVPRATYLGLLISTLIFIGVHCAVLFTLPSPALSQRPVYDAVVLLFGPCGAFMFAIFAVASCVATLNAIITTLANTVKTAAINKWITLNCSVKKGCFAWQGGLIFVVFAFFIMSNPCLSQYSVYIANSFVGVMYLFAVLTDIKTRSLDFFNFYALLSCILILYNINLITLALFAIVYFVAYIIKRMCRSCI